MGVPNLWELMANGKFPQREVMSDFEYFVGSAQFAALEPSWVGIQLNPNQFQF
jgi:hypothetical protein